MAITSLQITDFRNLQKAEFSPVSSGLNIIYGNNGSGKTSLLEAIYYLGHSRSFRSAKATRLVRHQANNFSLFANILNCEQKIPLGLQRDLIGTTRIRMAEKELSNLTELASILPIRLINSQSHALFESGPLFRRKFIDWGLFYQSESFLSCWRHFEHVLKQRNAVLRERRPKSELDVWTAGFIKHGLALDKHRRAYVAAITPIIIDITQQLLPIGQFEICYQSGWDENVDFATVLAHQYQDEMRAGYSLSGPHRADLDVVIDSTSVKHILSRGQQKLLICAMILAQGVLLAKSVNKRIIYLVDDLPSELDCDSRERLICLLAEQQAQIFITSIEKELIARSLEGSNVTTRVFHVEQGVVKLSV